MDEKGFFCPKSVKKQKSGQRQATTGFSILAKQVLWEFLNIFSTFSLL
jgi:hypothetical protein